MLTKISTPINNEVPDSGLCIQLHQMCTYGYPMDVSCSTFDPIAGLLIIGNSSGHIKIVGDSLIEYDFNINNVFYADSGGGLDENNNKSLRLSTDNSNPLFSYSSSCDKSNSKSFKLRFMKIFKKSISKDEPQTNQTTNLSNSDAVPTRAGSGLAEGDISTDNTQDHKTKPNSLGITHLIVNHLDKQLLVIDTDSRLSSWDLGCVVSGKLRLLSEIQFKYGEKLTTMCMLNGANKSDYRKFVCCGTAKGNVYMVSLTDMSLQNYCIYWNKSCKGATAKSPGEIIYLHPNIDKNPNYLLIGFKQGVLSLWNISEKFQHKLVRLKECIVSCNIVEENNLLFAGMSDGRVCVVCVSTMSVLSEHYPNNYLLNYHQNRKFCNSPIADSLQCFMLVDEISSSTANDTLSPQKMEETLTLKSITILKCCALSNSLNLVVFCGGNVNTNSPDDMSYNIFMNIVEVNRSRNNSANCVVHLPVPIVYKDAIDIHIHRNEDEIFTIVLHTNGMESFVSKVDELIKRLTNSVPCQSNPQNLPNCSLITNPSSNTSTANKLKLRKCNWPIEGGCVGEGYQSKKSTSVVILTHSDGTFSIWKCVKSGMSLIFKININYDLNKYSYKKNENIMNNDEGNSPDNNTKDIVDLNGNKMFITTSIGVYHHLNNSRSSLFEEFVDFVPKFYNQHALLTVTINNSTVCVYSLDPHSEILKGFNTVRTIVFRVEKQKSISILSSTESLDPYTHYKFDPHSNSNELLPIKLVNVFRFAREDNTHTKRLNVTFLEHFNVFIMSVDNLIAIISFPTFEVKYVTSIADIFLALKISIFEQSSVETSEETVYVKLGGAKVPKNSFDHYISNHLLEQEHNIVIESIHLISIDKKDAGENKWVYIFLIVLNEGSIVEFIVADSLIPSFYLLHFPFCNATKKCAPQPYQSIKLHILLDNNNFVSSDDQILEDPSGNQSRKIKLVMMVTPLSILVYQYEYDTAIKQNYLFENSTYSLTSNSEPILASAGFTIENHPMLTLAHRSSEKCLLITLWSVLEGGNSPPKSFRLERHFMNNFEVGPLIVPYDKAEIYLLLNHYTEITNSYPPTETYSIIRIHPFVKSDSNEPDPEKEPMDEFYPSLLLSDPNIRTSHRNVTNDSEKWNKFLNFFQNSFSTNKSMDYEIIFSKSSDIAVMSSVATTKNVCLSKSTTDSAMEANDPLRKAFLEREKKLKDAEIASKNMADGAKNFNDNISRLLDKRNKKRWF